MFLTIMAKAGCFNEQEAELAVALKNTKNTVAHDTPFSKEEEKELLKKIERFLGLIPESDNYLRKLKQLQRKGVKNLLENMTSYQMSTVVSLVGDGLPDAERSSIETLQNSQQ